ncbi:MAG TPA: tRNA uridine-5-carboxymethylaminomethyl(34) synthesis GTPase MnmE [Candidatus Hydrogenedentes bacterium]|nr:tRNA uridine-5-carboxymethylaminomethyl(34) synthesis GTPase MnmE [Candidatus Hydrogenedentota bacterium]HPU98522.1 tRNA uridine-5-carboxymethylaminomethyl(34) synthesis GTPase MnmE [Candidatus Hydrogenedentota bacterium]
MRDRGEDTIAAIATPPGEGAVAIIRISGPRVTDILGAVFRPLHGKQPPERTPWRLRHGYITDPSGQVLDEVLAVFMPAPRTYTGEPMGEIHGHGGPAVLGAILEAVMAAGARPAEPGEFTRRALLNGKIDLTQAEAVIDLIRARTDAALRAATAAAGGVLRRAIEALSDQVAELLARAEATVDFPEEDLPELVTDAWFDALRATRKSMAEHLDAYRAGRLFREGATVVIAGRPNAGKSTLFNRLLDEERAIVTDIPGTTRDILEGWTAFGGIPARLLDTAGMRDTAEPIEREGVNRARDAVDRADLVLWVMDLSLPDHTLREEWEEFVRRQVGNVLCVGNKSDMRPADIGLPELLRVSAHSGDGLPGLRDCIAARLRELAGNRSPDEPLLSHAHQAHSLRRAMDALDAALRQYGPAGTAALQPELLAFELREALRALGEITGETTPDDLLDRIFSQFCIGK